MLLIFEGSGSFSQSYDHFKILCTWASKPCLNMRELSILAVCNKRNLKFCLPELPFATFESQEKVILRLSEGRMKQSETFKT